MIKRYSEGLSDDERHDVLNVKQVSRLCRGSVKRAVGAWKDEGERSFKEYTARCHQLSVLSP